MVHLSQPMGQEYTPVGEAALKVGLLSVVAATFFGAASLGFCVLGWTPQPNALELMNSGRWPADARTNVQNTYAYFVASTYVWILACAVVFGDPPLFWAFSSLGMVFVDFFVQMLMRSGQLLKRLRSEGVLSPQRLVWFGYCVFVGGMTSPAFVYGADAVRISFLVTHVIALFLIVLSLVAPAGKYAAWRDNLKAFEAAVFVGSVGTALFPLSTSLGAIFFSVSFYGGLLLFSMYFLCDSQEAQIAASQATPEDPYCAVAMSVPMLLDIISIFTRVVLMVPFG